MLSKEGGNKPKQQHSLGDGSAKKDLQVLLVEQRSLEKANHRQS